VISYFARRLFGMIVTLLVVSVIVFIAGHLSGNPLTHLLSQDATPQQYAELGKQLGLNKPVYVQYFIYLGRIVRGNFGQSITEGQSVSSLILERMPATLELAGVAFLFALVIGLALGVFTSSRRGTMTDKAVQLLALTGQAIPSFWLGIVLIFIFAVHLRWLPAAGMESPQSVVLPAFALGWYFLAAFLRLMRSSMLDVMDTEYITMARARGLSQGAVVWKHAARNALLVPLTFVGVTLGTLITGALVIETVFAWPGMGNLAMNAVLSSDYPVLQGTVLVFTAIYMVASLIVDLLYAVVDPRVRMSGEG
jgi:peptide/nickel transport system permease protein